MSRSSFSCGQPFFYWKQFQSYQNYRTWKDNMILDPKYSNLKEEILLNPDNEVHIKQFNNLIALKANLKYVS